MWRRYAEAISGLASGLLGLAVVVFLAVGPVYQGSGISQSSSGTISRSSTASSLQNDAANWLLVVVIMLAHIIGGSALGHSLKRATGPVTLMFLFVATLALCMLVVLSLPSIGILLIPSVLLALLALVFGSLPSSEREQASPNAPARKWWTR